MMTEREEKVLRSEVRQLRLAVGSLLDLNRELLIAFEQKDIIESGFVEMTLAVFKEHKLGLGFRE